MLVPTVLAMTGLLRELADYGPLQAPAALGLAVWQWQAARERGLVPGPDLPGGRWSRAVLEGLAEQVPVIVEQVGTEAPAGSIRCAYRLAQRTGLEVVGDDVSALAEAGLVQVAGEYKGWSLYDLRSVDAVPVEVLAQVVAERVEHLAATVDIWQACEVTGWRRRQVEQVLGQAGLRPGADGRWDRAAVQALAADEDVQDRVRAERLVGPEQAAAELEIRRTDLEYLLAAGVLEPREWSVMRLSRYSQVQVPLYRVGDLDAVRADNRLPWEELRAVRPGEPSPLREIARRPPRRAAVVRAWVSELGARYGVEAWAAWSGWRWEVDYERGAGAPGLAQVRAELAAHPVLGEHAAAGEIAVGTAAGAAVRWARAMRAPGAAVVLDTETTHLAGVLVEVAVLDAATGEVLLETLVRPQEPISAEAQLVHGISEADVAGAPLLAEVLPQLLQVTGGRTVIAYNADFDASRLAQHAERDGLDLAHLGEYDRWACLMRRRSDWTMRSRWRPLEGGHRAAGDCRVAVELLAAMTAPHDPKGPW